MERLLASGRVFPTTVFVLNISYYQTNATANTQGYHNKTHRNAYKNHPKNNASLISPISHPLASNQMRLITTSTTPISPMHPPGPRSLKPRTTRQRPPQLHHRTRELIAYRCLALVVVDWRRRMSCASSVARSCCLGGCGCGGAL